MITKPNTVLVAQSVDFSGDGAVGSLVLLDAVHGIEIDLSAGLGNIKKLQLGVVKEAAKTTGHVSQQHPKYIAKSKSFGRDEVVDYRFTASDLYADTEDQFQVTYPADMTGITDADILHVRLDFKIDGHCTAKAEEYVFDLSLYVAAALINRINSNPDAWVEAEAGLGNGVVVVTAKRAIDYQPNAKSINSPMKYNQVEFDLASFIVKEISGTPAKKYVSFGEVVKLASAKPSPGNPYVVRDQEKDAFGYLGAQFSNQYPNIQPASSVAAVGGLVDETVTYDVFSLTAETKYRSADMSYMKSTGISAQVYVETSEETQTALESLVTNLNDWTV